MDLNPKQFGQNFNPSSADYSGTAHEYGYSQKLDMGGVSLTTNDSYDTASSAGNTLDEYEQTPGSEGWVNGHQSMNERPVEPAQGSSLSQQFVPNSNVGRSNLN